MADKYSRYEYIKRQDAFVASRKIGQKAYAAKDTAGAVTAMQITDELRAIPPVDAVAVVRCKDCKYVAHYTDGHMECRLIANLRPVPCTYLTMKDEDFCSYGEKREEIK